uniref:Alpha-L-rhamnosidase n=1 Tax=Bionectria ochroleuca TaxID=29856 RepID=A0A8H7NPZ3_BIOOC
MSKMINKILISFLSLASVTVCQSSTDPWSDTNWHKYVRSPGSADVKPVRILAEETTGNVSNPEGLLDGSQTTIFTRTQTEEEVPSVVIDFGLNVVGLLRIHIEGSSSSSGSLPGLRLAFSETEDALSDNKSDYTRSYRGIYEEDKLTDGTDQVAVQNETYTWTNTLGCEHGRQVCADGLHGFRYVKIWLDALDSDSPYTSSIGSVSISLVDLEWSGYLGPPESFAGWFECSDSDISQWWFDGVYTVETNIDLFLKNETEPRDAFSPTLDDKWVLLDGAKRDRDPYVGDLAIAALTLYLSHDFPEASFNVLEDLAVHQRDDGWIPPASIINYTLPLFDYPLWWVVCSVDLVMYTGNTSYAEHYWDVLKKTLDDFYPGHTNNDLGLLDKSASIGYGDYAFLPRSGPITYYNALYIHALNHAAQLATELGHNDDASRWTERAKPMGGNLIARNFDVSTGAFFDGGPCPNEPAGTICNVHAQDGNSIAILAGVTNDTLSTTILDYWANATALPYGNAFYDSSVLGTGDRFDERVYALTSYFELAARFSIPGNEISAYDELRRLYGWMATHDPGVTQWEGIGPGGISYQGPFMSYSHGWSTGIVPLMSNYVLGVKPTASGFSSWSICPVVKGELRWAKGMVPTGNGGSIKVSWEKFGTESIDSLALEVVVPGGTGGIICVPDIGRDITSIALNGEALPVNEAIKVDGGGIA